MIARAGQMVAALAVTQTAGYGVLYYAYSVFLPPCGWSCERASLRWRAL
ncbi:MULTISPECIES: hypothetical protein [Nonomuraea]